MVLHVFVYFSTSLFHYWSHCFRFCDILLKYIFWVSFSQKNCLGTIRNRNIANVCCVQFSAHSTNLLAFGSADYNIYCYDLRNARTPWCVLAGHQKSVSYVKFLDSETLVSASTDNTLKLWDLNKSSPSGPSTNACSLTLSGHTNEKVGPPTTFFIQFFILELILFVLTLRSR